MKPFSLPTFSLPILAISFCFSACETSPTESADSAEESSTASFELTAEALNNAELSFHTVGKRQVSSEVQAYGEITLSSDLVASVAARVDGIVLESQKSLGDTVQKGDVLAVIDSQELADSFLAFAQATSELRFATIEEELETQLFEKKLTSQESKLMKEQALTKAKMAQLSARQAIDRLGLTPAQIENAVESGSSQLMRRWQILAPISGVIAKREFTTGQAVTAQQELFFIANMKELWVDARVPIHLASALKSGEKIQFTAGQKEGECTVKVILPLVDSGTRTARMRATLDNRDGPWMPGTPVVLAISKTTDDMVLTVPNTALLDHEGRDVVFVNRGEREFELREVKIGSQGSTDTEILSGLKEGERIVTQNAYVLKAQYQMAGE